MALGGVFDDADVRGERGAELWNIHDVSEDVDGHDGFGFWRHSGEDALDADEESVRFDVHKHGRRACIHDGGSGGDRGVGRGDDFVAFADVKSAEGERESVGRVGDADAVVAAEIRSEFFFKCGAFVREDISPCGEHPFDCLEDFSLVCFGFCLIFFVLSKFSVSHFPINDFAI